MSLIHSILTSTHGWDNFYETVDDSHSPIVLLILGGRTGFLPTLTSCVTRTSVDGHYGLWRPGISHLCPEPQSVWTSYPSSDRRVTDHHLNYSIVHISRITSRPYTLRGLFTSTTTVPGRRIPFSFLNNWTGPSSSSFRDVSSITTSNLGPGPS